MLPIAMLTLFFNIVLLTAPRIIASLGGPAFWENHATEDLIINKEKLTPLHFYLHDEVTGPNTIVVRVSQAPTTNNSATLFRIMYVINNRLTVALDIVLKLVRRAQGAYRATSSEDFVLLMVLHCVFLEGKYNGSSLSVVRWNSVLKKVRQMPIVGGSSVIQFARGYVQAWTYAFDWKTYCGV